MSQSIKIKVGDYVKSPLFCGDVAATHIALRDVKVTHIDGEGIATMTLGDSLVGNPPVLIQKHVSKLELSKDKEQSQ